MEILFRVERGQMWALQGTCLFWKSPSVHVQAICKAGCIGCNAGCFTCFIGHNHLPFLDPRKVWLVKLVCEMVDMMFDIMVDTLVGEVLRKKMFYVL